MQSVIFSTNAATPIVTNFTSSAGVMPQAPVALAPNDTPPGCTPAPRSNGAVSQGAAFSAGFPTGLGPAGSTSPLVTNFLKNQ